MSVQSNESPRRFSAEVNEHLLHARAVEAVIWSMPAVNYALMLQAFERGGGGKNQIVYWSQLLDWKNQTLTPNPNAIYLMPFFTTGDGPMVLEVPPADEGSITGTIMDAWQCALEDVGPAGADQGKGGKYLLLPPGYKENAREGYIVLPMETYGGYALLRSILKGGSAQDVANAVAYGRRIKLYPLARAASPPETKCGDAFGQLFDATIPYDMRYFETLHRFIQAEPWVTRDKAMIAQLAAIGIEKGKPFSPDAKTRAALEDAIQEAHAWTVEQYEASYAEPYYKGGHWSLPVTQALIEGMANNFSDVDSYPVDQRGVLYTWAFSSIKHMGAGQFYLCAIRDKDGRPLDGAQSYRLTVPANAPVKQYWSATAYDFETHALIRDMPRSSRSSQLPELQKNADGSVDIWFGPKAPAGKEPNWVSTDAERRFEAMFRLYGPEKALFEKTWVLPDIEKVH